ncbi:hypothetical protein [Nostoc sp. CMAA1605]|uniref:hypothetical protein n=1 Tax=Nostoc sp. CMAA1605 TaxID=2055159 RepID=UPI001F1D20FB|nr:hypothetical protein [Nostoc sp. CMAA1605]
MRIANCELRIANWVGRVGKQKQCPMPHAQCPMPNKPLTVIDHEGTTLSSPGRNSQS